MFHSVYVEVFVSVSFCCECMCVCDESALKIKRQEEAACKKQTPRKIKKKECAQTTEVEEKKVFLICFPLYFQYDYNYLW